MRDGGLISQLNVQHVTHIIRKMMTLPNYDSGIDTEVDIAVHQCGIDKKVGIVEFWASEALNAMARV